MVSIPLWFHGLQHTRLSCLWLSPEIYSKSCPLSQWCYLTISFSATSFSFCLQSFLALGSFPKNWLSISDGQSFGASASVLPSNTQCWFLLELTGNYMLLLYNPWGYLNVKNIYLCDKFCIKICMVKIPRKMVLLSISFHLHFQWLPVGSLKLAMVVFTLWNWQIYKSEFSNPLHRVLSAQHSQKPCLFITDNQDMEILCIVLVISQELMQLTMS